MGFPEQIAVKVITLYGGKKKMWHCKGFDESLIKYREGKSTSGLCFTTLAHGKGVGDERCDILSARAAAVSGVLLKSLLHAGLQNEGSAVTREAAMSRQSML